MKTLARPSDVISNFLDMNTFEKNITIKSITGENKLVHII